jgi:pimeloyl-ACP methyl ester carboxylesterase
MVPTTDDGETVRAFADRFVDGALDEAAGLLSEDGRTTLEEGFPEEFREGATGPSTLLRQYRRGLHSQYGPFEGVDVAEEGDGGYTVTFEFADATETATVEVADAAVTAFTFAPTYTAPDYVDEGAFTERDLSVDAGDVGLDAVLTVPDGDGPFPTAVLVHGAGIHDPDGTAGNSKLLRDVAGGLATEGIAALRYEKRLALEDVPDAEFTVDRVVVDDALAALETAAAADDVDGDALFVVGHSQGGMCAPRIATRHGGLAGVVVLDALTDYDVDPDDDLTFLRYSLDPEGDLSEEQEAELEAMRESFERLAEGDYEDDETIQGRPGAWHRSVQSVAPGETAADLDAPAFVAKSGRADPEVQAELLAERREGYEAWLDVDLPAGSRVEFYDDVGHYFQTGPTPLSMVQLYFGGNVADHVVADLVAWIRDVTEE